MPHPGIPEAFRVLMKELQSLGLDVRVQDVDGNEIDIKQTYDEDEMGFDGADLAIGDDVVVEGELNDDYSIEDAPEDAGLDIEPDDSLFADDGLFGLSDDGLSDGE